MKIFLGLFFLTSFTAQAQRLASDYIKLGDKSGSVSVLGYSGTDGRTYVLKGAPDGTFAIPISGTFLFPPLPFSRNGVSTPVTLDTGTASLNRPLPISIMAGDSKGEVSTNTGTANASTLRFTLASDQFSVLATSSDLSAVSALLTTANTLQTTANTLQTTANSLQTTANTTLANGNINTSSVATSTALIESKTPALVSGRQPVDGSGVTQPVSASSLPLPSGASTSALQTTINATLTSGNTNTSSVATSVALIESKTPALVGGRQPVDGSGVTQPISATTLPLPTGAATETRQTSGNLTLSSLDSKSPALVGGRVPVDNSGVTQPISATALPLPTGASTSALQTSTLTAVNASKQKGKTVPHTTFQNYSTTNVTTGAWVQLISSVTANIDEIQIFDSSGQTLELGIGAAASETRLFLISPGGTTVQARIASGSRVSIRAVSGTASSGALVVNYIGEN